MKFARTALNILAIAGVILVNFVAPRAFAVAPEDLTLTLSDSRPSTVSDWTIDYDQSGGITFTDTNTLVITFPAGFNFGSVDDTDVDFTDNGSDRPVQSGACGSTNTVRYERSSQVVTFTACNSYTETSAGSVLQVKIGLNASGGNAQITNSTAATYSVTADATQEDAKDALIAIVAGVTVSATVDETLTVAVNAVSAGANCDDNGGTPTEITTTSTTVPFATISTETFYNGCQRIDVDTNAAGGYNVTVAQTQVLTSGGNTVAEGTCDGTCADATLGGWETATNNGFGYCADDRAGNAAADAGIVSGDQCDDATPLYYTFFTDPTEPTVDFMFSSGPISGDQTNVSFHLSVPGDQAAGAYTNTVYYVATATF